MQSIKHVHMIMNQHEQAGYNAAIAAIESGDVVALQAIFEKTPQIIQARLPNNPRALLHYLADWPGHKPNCAEVAQALIAAGADVNARLDGDKGETPLHWAASSDDLLLAQALLDGGAEIDIDGAVIGNGTPLTDAVFFSQLNVAQFLVERGATVNLPLAAGLGDMTLIQTLINTGQNRTSIDEALSYAAINGQLDAAAYLLDQGADINAMQLDEHSARTALHWAVYRDQQAMVELLVTQGADLTVCDTTHNATPLGWAEYHNRQKIATYLRNL